MDKPNSSGQFFKAVLHELFLSKRLYNLLASTILLGVVVAGYFWPESYVSSATIIVEKGVDQNTPGALDENRQQLEDLLKSPLFIGELEKSLAEHEQWQEAAIEDIARHLVVERQSSQLLRVSLRAASPQAAQNLLQEVLDAALDKLIPIERIDDIRLQLADITAQMESLQRELNAHEVKLASGKDGAASNLSAQILTRIASLRAAIQDDEVSLLGIDAKIKTIRREYDKEKSRLNQAQAQDKLRRQRDELNNTLLERRREFGIDAPEAVAIEVEIEQLTRQLNALPVSAPSARDSDLYEQLRKQLTLAEVEREALLSRTASLQTLLENELAKVDGAQNSEQEYQQLRKDYEANSERQRELAKQKDQLEWQLAQLAAVLDVYKVFSKPALPATYSGLGIVEFLLLSPLLAIVLPFILAILRVVLDARIRTARQLKTILPGDVPVLAEIPHFNSPQTSRLFRKAMLGLLFWALFVLCVYFALGFFALKG